MINYKRPTVIRGLSDQRRLPRLGKIRLGVKKVSPKSGKEYPTETSYFVVPPEVEKVYGNMPTELDVMIPVEDSNVIIPQAYEMYGSGKGLKCVGDGVVAYRHNEKTKDMAEIECPCDHLGIECKQRAHLRVILPKVNVGGVYQIDTSSYNSIIDINSSIDYIRALVGRIALVPLKLKRVPTETHHDGKKQTHFTMRLELEADIGFINQLRENTARILVQAAQYSLPPPVTENPAIDEGGIVVVEEVEEVEEVKKELVLPVSSEPAIDLAAVQQKEKTIIKEYLSKVLFPKLKELGYDTKQKAVDKLKEFTKIESSNFENVSMETAEALFIALQESLEKK